MKWLSQLSRAWSQLCHGTWTDSSTFCSTQDAHRTVHANSLQVKKREPGCTFYPRASPVHGSNGTCLCQKQHLVHNINIQQHHIDKMWSTAISCTCADLYQIAAWPTGSMYMWHSSRGPMLQTVQSIDIKPKKKKISQHDNIDFIWFKSMCYWFKPISLSVQ